MNSIEAVILGQTCERICLNTNPYPQTIPIGSTKTSAVAFWMGVGLLEYTPTGSYKPWILSPHQFTQLLDYGYVSERVQVLSGENLNTVMIADHKFFIHLGVYTPKSS